MRKRIIWKGNEILCMLLSQYFDKLGLNPFINPTCNNLENQKIIFT